MTDGYLDLLMESNADNTNLNPTVSKNGILNSLPDNTISYQNDNCIFPRPSQVEPSSRALIFDTKDLLASRLNRNEILMQYWNKECLEGHVHVVN